ncbi:MAG: FG-GAP-like repeat-containing protein [Acidobacteriota bacterium]
MLRLPRLAIFLAFLLFALLALLSGSLQRPAHPSSSPDSAARLRPQIAFARARLGAENQAQTPAEVDWEKAYRHNNLGVAHMEQHRYGKAVEEFRRVSAIAPEWPVGYVNLGIALYSSHQSKEADASFRRALELDPESLHAHYGLGLLQKVRGDRQRAIASFLRVAELNPQDADARYNLGLLYQWTGEWQKSARHLEEAMALDPTNISAIYKLATALLNAGKTAEGQAMMERFRVMSADPSLGTTRGLQYGEQGRYAEVITEAPSRAVGSTEAPAPTPVKYVDVAWKAGLRFRHLGPGDPESGGPSGKDAAGSAGFWGSARRRGSGVAVGDVDGDGDLDLCFAEVGGDSGPALRLYLNSGDMKFSERTAAAGLSVNGLGMACYLGDIDNDDDLDLFLSAATGGNHLFRNEGGGKFSEVTREAGLARAPPSAGAAFADVDHDGDLDLYLIRFAAEAGASAPENKNAASGREPAALWLNRGDGSFQAAETAPPAGEGRSAGVIFSDFDNDRDIDFLVLETGGAPQLFSNLRGGRWEEVADSRGLERASSARAAALGDFNKDGFMDLALAGASPSLLWRNDGGKRFLPLRPGGVPAAPKTLSPIFLDFDNDGFLDLFAAGGAERPLLLWRNLGGGRFADASSAFAVEAGHLRGLRGAAAADLDGDGDLDLVITRNGAAPLLLRNDGGNARRWLKVRTRGLNSTRQGIGTKVEVQAGGLWQKAEVNGGSGYLSQGPSELLFGLGERPGAEFVRLLWPGGVLQSELEIAASRSLVVEELDRKGSSCPLLYAWNGTRFGFVADFVGGGGIGVLVAPGRYARPDPTEYVKIAAEQLQPRHGWLDLRVVQQLEEVAYIDRLELLVVDHLAQTEIFPNERFMTGPPYPRFEVYEISGKLLPRAAHDGRGRDRLEALRRADRVYADGLRLLAWPGYAEPHAIVLEFGPEAAGGGWRLFLDGWVDYGYSYANYAASQMGLGLKPPRLERPTARGGWEVLTANIGYPAGISRTMVAAGAIEWPGDDRRLRVSTNMRVFWDHAFLARPKRMDERRLPRLPAARAELHYLGYPREFSPDGRKPYLYDYALVASSFPWKNMRGRFTRYGDVRELLRQSDDRFVIMNRGDEIALRFDSRSLPPLPAGWKRDYLLFADGYVKDMDLHGAFPDTVEPLPFHAMSGYPYGPNEQYPQDRLHRNYQERWNTRILWQE